MSLLTTSAEETGKTQADQADDDWLQEYLDSITDDDTVSVEAPPLEQMTAVANNHNFELFFHEEGMDIYVRDKRNQTVWSNAIDKTYIDLSDTIPSVTSALLSVSVVQGEGNLLEYTISKEKQTSGFAVETEYANNAVTLHFSLSGKEGAEGSLAFDFKMWLDEDGLLYSIPAESLKESGALKLVSIDVFPSFGASRSDEKGYLFYPDGSGSLIRFKPYDQPNAQQYVHKLYGLAEPDVDKIHTSQIQGDRPLMLPVFGINRTSSGLFAAITEGEQDAILKTGMPGYQISGAYRANFAFQYRTYATAIYDFSDKKSELIKLSKLVPDMIRQTHTVKYFLLTEGECDYSSMAVLYRNHLEKTGMLKKNGIGSAIPLSLDFFMGISRENMFNSSTTALTTFGQAQEILMSLRQKGVTDVDVLLTGWGKGGYDTLPTIPKPDGRLGGKSGLEALGKFCSQNACSLYAALDFLNADLQTGTFNLRQDTLRDYTGRLLTDELEERKYLLNPVKTLQKNIENAFKTVPAGMGFLLEGIGERLVYDYNSKNITYGLQSVESYQSALRAVSQSGRKAAVSGGNAYVLPFVSRLYDIPDGDSAYFQNDESVPFYQMVVHGSVPYTSLAGNQSQNYRYQKLKWVETGSNPHFLLTHENPILLKGTSCDSIFSSEFSQWGEVIHEIYTEFQTRLQGVWSLKINRHEFLTKDVVRITYENGDSTVINYSAQETTVAGVTVAGMDYAVIKKGA